MKIRNVSHHDLLVPRLGRVVVKGAVVDVPDDEAESFLMCSTLWREYKPAAPASKPAAKKVAAKKAAAPAKSSSEG